MLKQLHYFDYASTTPVHPKVLSAMIPYFKDTFGNSGSLHKLGRISKNAIDESSEKICNILKCKSDEIIYTGSATESDNLAILGIARANKDMGNRIIISKIEHKAILSSCDVLKKEGFDIIEISPDKNGLINPIDIEKFITPQTILISITSADSETGTIQPITEIAKMIKKFRLKNKSSFPYFHTDASQAFAFLDLKPDKVGLDLMTISSHKMYGPKGIGLLYIRRGVKIKPIIHGGGQQRNMRSGTENIPAIVGFATSLELNNKEKKLNTVKIKKLRNFLEKEIFKSIPKVILNGHKNKRLPNFLNISFLDIEGEAILLYLDDLGIMASTGSACNSQNLEPSHILIALNKPYEHIHGSIRFSLGIYNTISDIKYLLKNLPNVIKKLREMSPLNLNINQKKYISNLKSFTGNQTPHFIKRYDSK